MVIYDYTIVVEERRYCQASGRAPVRLDLTFPIFIALGVCGEDDRKLFAQKHNYVVLMSRALLCWERWQWRCTWRRASITTFSASKQAAQFNDSLNMRKAPIVVDRLYISARRRVHKFILDSFTKVLFWLSLCCHDCFCSSTLLCNHKVTWMPRNCQSRLSVRSSNSSKWNFSDLRMTSATQQEYRNSGQHMPCTYFCG